MNAQNLNAQAFIESLYQAVDARSPERLAEFLHPEVNFRFANADAIRGKSAVLEANSGFFSSIEKMSHTIDSVCQQDDQVICNGQVDYIRLDGSAFSAQFATVLRVNSKLITDYLIYADVSGL